MPRADAMFATAPITALIGAGKTFKHGMLLRLSVLIVPVGFSTLKADVIRTDAHFIAPTGVRPQVQKVFL